VNPVRVESILRQWREKAERGLAAGIEYACAIRPRRVRFATALPALIGTRTLSLLREAGPDIFERTVKVSRADVRKIMASTAARLASSRVLRERSVNLSRDVD
jgi:farnesyl-diphosphate farnesyltransferase